MQQSKLDKNLIFKQKEVIEFANSLKWIKSIERNINLFCMSLRAEGMKTNYYDEALGAKVSVSGHANLNGQIYDPIGVVERTRKHLKKSIKDKGVDSLFKIARSCYKTARNLHNFLEKIDGFSLKERFSKFVSLYLKLCPYLGIVRFSEKILQDELNNLIKSKIKDDKKSVYYFENLSFVRKEIDSTKEIKAILEIAKEIKYAPLSYKDLKIKKLIKEHLKNFDYMKVRWNFENPYTKKEIEKRIKNYTTNNPTLDLKKINEVHKNAEEVVKEFVRKFNLTKKERELIDIIREFVYLRTFRTDAFFKSHHLIKPLLIEIADNLKISFEQLLYLQFEEVLDLLDGKKLNVESLIKERKKGWYLIMSNNMKALFCGKERNMIDNLGLFSKEIGKKNKVFGRTASLGKVSGKARVIKSVDDCKNMKEGEILVSVMTFPQYVIAFEKALALVTDEGGILCHAAIIAREMGKPCITGTQFATEIFKTGDLLEVDATNGIARKI